jgi:hypothetical protein
MGRNKFTQLVNVFSKQWFLQVSPCIVTVLYIGSLFQKYLFGDSVSAGGWYTVMNIFYLNWFDMYFDLKTLLNYKYEPSSYTNKINVHLFTNWIFVCSVKKNKKKVLFVNIASTLRCKVYGHTHVTLEYPQHGALEHTNQSVMEQRQTWV